MKIVKSSFLFRTLEIVIYISISPNLLQPDKDKSHQYWTSVFTQEKLNNIPQTPNIILGEELQEHKIELEEGQKKLLKLNTFKSPGPNKLHSRILKEVAAVDKPLGHITPKSIEKKAKFQGSGHMHT